MSSKRHPLIVLCVALIFVCSGVPDGKARAAQGQVVPVGIVAFQDESGTEVAPELVGGLARTLQQRLAAAHKDLLPRAIVAEPGTPPPGALSVEQLAALGQGRGLRFVVRGGVLAVTPGAGGGATVAQVYAEVVRVAGGELRGVRAEAEGSDASAALSAAIEKLAEEIYRAVVSPPGEAASGAHTSPTQGESNSQAPASSDESDADTSAVNAEEAGAAEADEELQQLIAQSESLAASGAGSAESLGALNRALEGLKNALATKAARLEQAQETAQADAAISARRQELESAVSRLTEETAAAAETTDADEGAAEEEQSSGEKKKLTTSINDFLGESLSILQKIQEIRAVLRGAGEEQASTGDEAGDAVGETATEEEATEEVSGVVTEGGEPVEGVEVTEPESGQSATTGADGSYMLKGVPAGRMSNLVLTKAGTKMAAARLDLPRGRAAVADFELKQRAGVGASPLRVVPSLVVVRKSKAAAGGVGALKGVVRDAKGQPLARALVTLQNLAVARTDSAGRYTFLNVPAGAHQLTIYRSGLRPKTERVEVAAKKSSESRIAFAPADKTTRQQMGARLISRGVGTILRGSVLDENNRPLTGAKVSVVETGARTGGVLSALANQKGGFELRDLKPGSYRVLVSKTGYEATAQGVAVRAGASAPLDFRLKRIRTAFLDRTLDARSRSRTNTPGVRTGQTGTQGSNRPEERRATTVGVSRPQTAPVLRNGQLSGLVVDAKTGKPLAVAVVSVAGLGNATTNREGRFIFPNAAPGTHRINVRLRGYNDAVATAIVRIAQTTTLSLRLIPGVAPTQFRIR